MTGSWRASGTIRGIGGVDALDVREDLAAVRLELRREGDRRGVRAAPAEGRDLGGVDVAAAGGVLEAVERGDAHALEAGDDDDLAGGQLGLDAARVDAGDPGPAVAAVRRDPGLRAGEADRRDADRMQRHRDEGGALVLAGGEEDVELAGIGIVRDGGREGEELVGGVAHRRDDDDEARPVGPLAGDAPGDALDALRAGDGRAAELHDDEGAGHGGNSSGGCGRTPRNSPAPRVGPPCAPPTLHVAPRTATSQPSAARRRTTPLDQARVALVEQAIRPSPCHGSRSSAGPERLRGPAQGRDRHAAALPRSIRPTWDRDTPAALRRLSCRQPRLSERPDRPPEPPEIQPRNDGSRGLSRAYAPIGILPS